MESAKGEIRGMSDRRSDRFDTGLADRSDADLEGGEQLRQVQGSSLDLMGAGSAGLGKRRISLSQCVEVDHRLADLIDSGGLLAGSTGNLGDSTIKALQRLPHLFQIVSS